MIDFELTDTQKMMVGTARDFGKEVLGPAEVALDRIADPAEAYGSEIFRSTLAGAYAPEGKLHCQSACSPTVTGHAPLIGCR